MVYDTAQSLQCDESRVMTMAWHGKVQVLGCAGRSIESRKQELEPLERRETKPEGEKGRMDWDWRTWLCQAPEYNYCPHFS